MKALVAISALLVLGTSVASVTGGDAEYYDRYCELRDRNAVAWFSDPSLVDTNNAGPSVAHPIPFRPFFEEGEFSGIQLGMSMSEVVAAWGRPHHFGAPCGIGPRMYYRDTVSLVFRDDQLVLIALWGRDMKHLRFDNGLQRQMSKDDLDRVLGMMPQALPDAGVYDGHLRYRTRRTRLDLLCTGAETNQYSVVQVAVRLLGAGELGGRANKSVEATADPPRRRP